MYLYNKEVLKSVGTNKQTNKKKKKKKKKKASSLVTPPVKVQPNQTGEDWTESGD